MGTLKHMASGSISTFKYRRFCFTPSPYLRSVLPIHARKRILGRKIIEWIRITYIASANFHEYI